MADLLAQHCRPKVSALDAAELIRQLGGLQGWVPSGNAIEKTFRFGGWLETMAFLNAVAWLCHTEDHHPDATVGFDRCVLRFSTHSVGGVSLNDLICAAKVDALVPAGSRSA